jgi:hypothetical protein
MHFFMQIQRTEYVWLNAEGIAVAAILGLLLVIPLLFRG